MERSRDGREALEARLASWREYLSGDPPVLELPGERPRPRDRSLRREALEVTLPKELRAAARELGREDGGIPFTALLAALFALLHRYTGHEDLVVAGTVPGSGSGEAEDPAGEGAETVVLRAFPEGRWSFRRLLEAVRAEVEEAREGGGVPYEQLVQELRPERVRELGPEREAPDGPPFRVRFRPHDDSPDGGASEPEASPPDLDVAVEPADGQGLTLVWEYAADVLDRTGVERMAGHFRTLLQGALDDPDRTLAGLPLLSAAEEAQLRAWEEAPEALDVDPTRDAEPVHHLVARRAREAPGAPAVVAEGETTTYGDLARRAAGLARWLRALPAWEGGRGEPEPVVALLTGRSPETASAALGVLAAGGAYLPMDPEYPPERIAYMLEDSGAVAVVALEELRDVLPPDAPPVLTLDEAGQSGVGEDDLTALLAASEGWHPERLAYVIYTSGSTGRPKGVELTHRGLTNLVAWHRETYGVGPGDRATLLSGPGFDAAVWELWPCLASGASLHVPPEPLRAAPEALVAWLGEEGVTVSFLATPLAEAVLDAIRTSSAPAGLRLRALLTGGDRLHRPPPPDLPFELVNHYGPTESTVVATAGPVAPGSRTPPPIGRPIEGLGARILDRGLRRVPAGVPGELCVAGRGLARGYRGRPGWTAEAFVPDPVSEETGGRLYRTGDLARHFPDGEIDFLGRIDTQVQVRGFRVELGEIESVLADHPEVAEAVVLARTPPRGGEARLVGYTVARGDAGEDTEVLRAWLARRLPEYMVPRVFVPVPEIPLTPNGKVDRAALPVPELGQESRAPETGTEKALAAIWAEILGLEGIGVRDDLFRLGGHSLIVTRIATRVRQELGRELPLLTLFERPTVEELAAWLDGEESAREEAALELPPIPRAPRDEGPIPASFNQERVWFLLQLARRVMAYNFQFTLRFRGGPGRPEAGQDSGLNPGVLEDVLTEIVRRHEVLRTTFPAVDGRPVQEIHEPFRVTMPRIDLTALPEGRRLPEAHTRVRREVRRGLDVTRLPLFRPRVFVLSDDDHLFLQVEHHFVHDGWSLAVYLREMRDLYAAFARGRPSPLPDLPIQYADFAVWQRSWMEGEAYERQLAYWLDRLSGELPVLALPTDRPRPPAYTFEGGALRVDMPDDLYAAARRFGREQGMTLYMTMLATFYALLHRYTGQEDVLLGSGVANRRHRETEDLVGFIVNTLVLRGRPRGRESFRRLLEGVRGTTLEAHLHQDMPFERLVQELQPERDLSRNPLFQVLFSFHDAAVPEVEVPELGLTSELFEWHNGSAKSDLNIVVKPMAEQRVGQASSGGEVLTMIWEYSGDIFDRTTVERMWGHYRVLLRGAIEDPRRSLAELPLVTAAEEAQIRAWEEAPSPWTPAAPEAPDAPERSPPRAGEPVHRLVARRARQTPGAPAVVAEGSTLTYGELAARAAELARRLRELPGWDGPEPVAALLTGRSPETAVGALGVLAAGGAYLPVDPEYPPERIATMLADSGAVAVLLRADLRDELEDALPDGGPPVIHADLGLEPGPEPDPEGASGEAAELPRDGDLDRERHPERLAYVIYTSGSTGRPKGVELTHRGLANLVAWHQETYKIGPGDRATLLSGPGFDAAVWELWPYLAAGASLHVPPEPLRAAPVELLAWLAEAEITVAFLATPLAEAVLEALREGSVPETLRLRALLTGGDRLHRPPPPGLPFELVNHYGPTESTVVATVGEVPPGSRTPPPIGRPIAGLGARILDRHLRRVPAGVPGELAVAGRGLARAYRGRAAWTAEAFVPDPVHAVDAGEAGERIYRTGDLARYLPDGRIDFLGRLDTQVQVRGFRVELGEIESVLADHPEVREAVVLARTPAAGAEARLVAYVVHQEGEETPDGEALREWLGRRLPEYMVPRLFVAVPEVPLTADGKVDRAALPEPEPEAEPGAAGYVAPGSPLEEVVAGVWAEVLGREEVGVRDDFFDLGGHSLLATRVLSRVRDATGVEVPLTALFEARTVEGLAAVVERSRRGEEGVVEDRIPRRSGEGPAPLSFAQERLWFLDRLSPGTAAYVIARAYRVDGPLEPRALAGALTGIVRRHEALRTRFVAGDDAPEQRIDPPRPVPLRVIDLSALPGAAADAEARRRAAEHARRPFDLAAGPVLRTALLRTGEGAHHLLVAFHHIASDGWSMGVFHRELAALYGGRPAELPSLEVQYPDFAAWQRRRLQGDLLDEHLAFWREHLAGAPALLELPTDRPRPPVQRFRGARVGRELPAERAAALDRLARESGSTRFMVLLAAFATLLGRTSHQADVVVGTPVAGRVRSELEPLIGFFVNTLPLRLTLDPEASFRDLVGRARTATLDGHARQELPFEKLVEELQPDRSLSHSPLFQVLLTVQEEALEAPALAGLETAVLPLERREARFDLELAVTAGDGGGLALDLRYDRDLFDRETARRMTRHLGTLLAGAAADPDASWEALPLLSEEERREVLAAGQGPDLPPDLPGDAAGEPGIHREVARQAGHTPEAEALAWSRGGEAGRLTYRELVERTHRLARHLIDLGVASETPVAVFLPRTPDLVVALLAVLEAGGAYVPLDPDYPEERLRFILEDTGAPVVLTEEGLAERLPHQLRKRDGAVVRLDADAETIAARRPDAPEVPVAPESLAYVIYTSGSTGRPKGVAIPHRATRALLAWARGVFRAEELTGVLASTSVCFDLSVFELFVPLTAGGRVILADTVLALPEHPARDEVTLVNTVPSAMAELVGLSEATGLPDGLTTVNLAGEPLRPDLVDRIYERGVARVHDLYGPSEDTTYSTFARREPGGPEVIGRPVAGTRAHLLDPRMEPVPPGVAGELHLGGAGLVRGYLRRPARTAEGFVPDPFGSGGGGEPGARLYGTGDLARRLPSGELQFLGRIDHQVKVRGFRIELGEIEAALTDRSEVREAVVVAPAGPSGEPGDRRLVAYAVPEEGAGHGTGADPGIDPEALREALAERLPGYMVPSAVVLLPELPRLPNGKIDREALPDPRGEARGEIDHVPPETDTEKALAEIWREVLGLDRVGARDDFFRLGGHSLLATRVIARTRSRLGADLPLQAIFRNPTVQGLAREVETARETGEEPARPTIRRLERTRRRRPERA